MSHDNIQTGDEVSWNWGGGHPTGKVAEIKTSGKLEIESKGKRVHKNANEHNPAVHVERSGNDVVKRASELNRLRGGGEDAPSETVEGVGEGAMQGVSEKEVQEGGEGGSSTTTTAATETEAGAAPPEAAEAPADEGIKRRGGRARGKRASVETRKEAGKKGAATRKAKAGGRGRGKAVAEQAVVGEKREREDVEVKEGEEEGVTASGQEEAVEKEAGKEAKKAKIVPEDGEPTPGAGVVAELRELKSDNEALGLDVDAAGAKPRAATRKSISANAGAEAGDAEEPGGAVQGAESSTASSGKKGGRGTRATKVQ